MNVFEYQAKEIFRNYGIPAPRGRFVRGAGDLKQACEETGFPVVLKAQTLGGGRGKAGGVRFAEDLPGAEKGRKEICALSIRGQKVEMLLVEEKLPIQQELYLGITISPEDNRPSILLSTMGGIEVETMSAEHPEKMAQMSIDPYLGVFDYSVRELAIKAGLPTRLVPQLCRVTRDLYRVFRDYHAVLVEINPLAVVPENKLIAADARLAVDDNAVSLYGHLAELKKNSGRDTIEDQMKQKGIDYVELEGNIGIISVGAGESMATMDLVRRAGGTPACFLDFSGGVNTGSIEMALRTVSSLPEIKAILFNIFGGLTRIDQVAQSFLEAWERLGNVSQPVVMRVEGTNVIAGRQMLDQAGFASCVTLNEAILQVVERGGVR